jgi:hypothetical protein
VDLALFSVVPPNSATLLITVDAVAEKIYYSTTSTADVGVYTITLEASFTLNPPT